MQKDIEAILKKIANTIRKLSIEAIEKASSGHPGLPLGCAELAAYLYGYSLTQYPKDPSWLNRDRFVLSAGHGSMLLYSCLHLSGYDISIDDIKNFRQMGSKTPGHPEYDIKTGVEATTGPLGQGFANAVGMAIANKKLQSTYNKDSYNLFDSKVFCLAGDGCIMEGISSEASSLAGHLNLDNLIVIYDCNSVCLDGPTSEVFSENTIKRYESYGWDTYQIDGHDFSSIDSVISNLKKDQKKPAFIVANTVIGMGSPNKSGNHKVHGSPLGKEELLATKKNLKVSEDDFFVEEEVYSFFNHRLEKQKENYNSWMLKKQKWGKENNELLDKLEKMQSTIDVEKIEKDLKNLSIPKDLASRASSNKVINFLADILPSMIGGSADLSSSDKTMLDKFSVISSENFSGRNIKYGVREFAMGGIANGLSYSQVFLPFIGTFLVFSDYLRNSIRVAALSKLKVIYQFTHDSVFLAEDGPTHQPIEHIASLRAIPNLQVIRPCCSYEVKMAWLLAISYNGPSAICLSRQSLKDILEVEIPYKDSMAKGAYIILKEKEKADFTIFATGSEVQLAIDVANALIKKGKNVRVVSMPCMEAFEKQDRKYKNFIIGGDIGKRISIEAGSSTSWYKYIGLDGIAISIDRFGISAKEEDIKKAFGFRVEDILKKIL